MQVVTFRSGVSDSEQAATWVEAVLITKVPGSIVYVVVKNSFVAEGYQWILDADNPGHMYNSIRSSVGSTPGPVQVGIAIFCPHKNIETWTRLQTSEVLTKIRRSDPGWTSIEKMLSGL